MKKEIIISKDPKSPIAEIFRTLRTNIQFMNTTKNSKTILVTSTFPGEGKSWVSTNLAAAFAQTGKKVILIDSDMRKGRQYSILEVSPTPGLSNYLSGVNAVENDKKKRNIKEYIQKTEIENLHVMVAGNIPPNPSELLSSTEIIDLLEKVKKLYDIVIIDGTPCQLVADSLILARIVDSTIVVAAYKSTKKKDLKRVITGINNVGGKIFGIVLNKIPVPAKKYEQSYYYGSAHENKAKKEVVEPKEMEEIQEETETTIESKLENKKENIEDNKIENATGNKLESTIDNKLEEKKETITENKLENEEESITYNSLEDEEETKEVKKKIEFEIVGRPEKKIDDTSVKRRGRPPKNKEIEADSKSKTDVAKEKKETKPKKEKTRRNKKQVVIEEKRDIVIPLFDEIMMNR